MPEAYRGKAGGKLASPGPYIAKVVSHLDPTYMGILQVELLAVVGNYDKNETQLHQVRYISPFLGQTSIDYTTDTDDYNNTQKSYGMWMIPPDPGNFVIVMFIDGDPAKGYWFGCIQDENMNFQVPGYAATKYHVDGQKDRVPVAEYNKRAKGEGVNTDGTKNTKPASPLEQVLLDQGTLEDDIRGITTSSARREVPSAVYGISTPGPIDQSGPTGKVGKKEHTISNAKISRLGGSSFVMDDGDDKFVRKEKPTDGPPEYANKENDESGINEIPHNELIRFRTRTGHQILLHNSEDLIYIGNARGTAWIELTSDGKMDIFTEDSINIRTKNDINMTADRDFNLEVGRNFNVKVKGERHTHVVKDDVLIVDRDQKVHVKRRRDETIDEQYRQTVHDDVKKYYAKDYTHNIDGRQDHWVADAGSFTIGNGPADPKFAPYDSRNDSGDDPVANDDETSVPVADHNGATPDRVDIKIYKDTRVEHVGKNVDHIIGAEHKLTVSGNQDVNVGGHVFTTSGASNETKAGGNIIETAPQIHMNGPGAATAAKATNPEDARISAKGTIPLQLKQHNLPDMEMPNAEEPVDKHSIMRRIPTPEPYPLHENLDPKRQKPEETDRDIDDARYTVDPSDVNESMREPAEYWKKYTTGTDTFSKGG